MSLPGVEEILNNSLMQNSIDNGRRHNSTHPHVNIADLNNLSNVRNSQKIGEYRSSDEKDEPHEVLPKLVLMKQQSDISNTSANFRLSSETILQWSNLTVVREKDNQVLLNSLNGEVFNNHSLAIMGSSGAGKTTLLNYLSKKMSTPGLKKTMGDITLGVNGKDESRHMKEISAFVTQDDILFEVLTPRELLQFAADIKLVGKTEVEKKMLIEKILLSLGLEDNADTKVGSVLNKGISGGERKRAAIAYELITEPMILFLDEPTSGLDSTSSFKIVNLICEEARRKGRIVIFTIHQPNAETFKLFDNFLLMAKGGRTIYNGKASDAIEYFNNLNFPCPKNYNPAEYFIEMVSNTPVLKLEENKEEQLIRDEEYAKKLDFFEQTAKKEEVVTDLIHLEPSIGEIKKIKNSFFDELGILLHRNRLLLSRDPTAFMVRLLQSIIFAVLLLLIFFQLGKGNNAIRDREGVLIFAISLMFNLNFNTPLLAFTNEKKHFYKEQDNSMYRVTTYYLSKTLSEIVVQMIMSIIVWGIIYYPCGLNPNSFDNSLWFILTIFGFGYACLCFSYFISAIIDKLELIPTIFPVLIFTQILTSGFFINIRDIPYVFYPFKYISLFRYSYQALVYNEFDNNTDLDCHDPQKCILPMSDFPESKELSIIILFIIAFLMNILTCITLKVKAYFHSKHK